MKRSKAPNEIMTILLTRDFDDRVTKYAIKKLTGLTFPWVSEVVGSLKTQGLIETKVIGTAPGKQPMVAYALTLEGLFTIFYEIPELWDRIDEIAANHVRLLPLIFGRWDLLAQPKLKEFLVRGLRVGFQQSTLQFKGHVRTIEGELVPQNKSTLDYRLSIYWQVFSQMATSVMEKEIVGQRNAWLRVTEDQVLRAFTDELFNELIPGNEAFVSDFKSIREAQRNPTSFRSKASALAKFDKNQEARREKMKNLILKLERNLMRR